MSTIIAIFAPHSNGYLMKKLTIIAFALLVSVFTANAQLSIGANSGGVLGGDTYKNATFAPGYFGELEFRYFMKNDWFVTFAPRFESSSYQSRKTSPYEFYYFTNSMEFPIHYGHRSAIGSKTTLFFDFGPSMRWIMTNDYYGSVYGVTLGSEIHPKDLGYTKLFNCDVGMNIGVEIWNHMKIYAGCDFGVLPEQTKAFLENFQVDPTHSFSVRVGVGYFFTFKKRNR
jgi:hypothetical protein